MPELQIDAPGVIAGNTPRRKEPEDWPASIALAFCWLLPATASRRSTGVGLLHAWVLHVVTALASTLAVFILVAIADPNEVMWIFREFSRSPVEVTLAIAGIALLIECGFLGLAWIVMPWGGVVERFQDSLRHALRQTWLHTSHAFVLILVWGVFILGFLSYVDDWRRQHSSPNLSYPMPPPAGASKAQQDAYQADMQRYQQEWQNYWAEYYRTAPWHVQQAETVVFIACMMGIGWFLWSLLRGVGARLPSASLPRPPSCEFCGYNLTATPMDARCPECGEPARRSLGGGLRVGPPICLPWELGWGTAYLDTIRLAVSTPREFGFRLRAFSPGSAHRWFMAVHLPFAFTVCFAGVLAVFFAVEGFSRSDWDDFFWPASGISLVVATMWPLLVCAVASTIGTLMWVTARHTVLPGAMQGACYLSPLLLLWLAWLWGSGAMIIAARNVFVGVRSTRTGFVGTDEMQFLAWALLAAASFLLVNLVLWRIAAATRYANA